MYSIVLFFFLVPGTFKLYEKHPDVETPAEEEESEGKAEKGKENNYKRKRSKDDRSSEDNDDPDPSSASTPSRKKPGKKPSFCEFLNYSRSKISSKNQEIWKWPIYKTHLPVTCGDKEGTLYRDKMPRGEKCILSQGRWFTPNYFEKFAGKEKCKNWKLSIHYINNYWLLYLLANISFLGWRGGGTEIRGRVEEEDMADLSVFQDPSLPVTCVSLTGTLYKYRFATGIRGKCIRTEERWFTPEEFVKQEPTITDGHWKKDIVCRGKTLNFLLKKEILLKHLLLCDCQKCSIKKEDLNNDDECYVCDSEGHLVCCDECPRAFHSHCHLPAVHGDSPGEWICTFCVLRTSQQWRDSSNMSEQEAFGAPVSQYRLVNAHTHTNSVPRYSEFISQPMWLDRIKQKLESGEYQTVGAFVSDFHILFSCSLKDNVFGRMGARLKEMFEEEFQKIFSIQ
uniref:SP110 nuclear body protein, tandem duplicate 2 n=1 Tax=Sinocyclocheilus rhinocerous TaxID=307959 RepID=A0A673FLE6_9TELE